LKGQILRKLETWDDVLNALRENENDQVECATDVLREELIQFLSEGWDADVVDCFNRTVGIQENCHAELDPQETRCVVYDMAARNLQITKTKVAWKAPGGASAKVR
jgi:hypothetical protein